MTGQTRHVKQTDISASNVSAWKMSMRSWGRRQDRTLRRNVMGVVAATR